MIPAGLLAIQVTVRQAQQAVQMIRTIREEVILTAEDIRAAKLGAMELGAALGIALVALRAAGDDQAMRLQLQAITHSGRLAYEQIRQIRALSEDGLFSKQELFESIKLFDETKTSIRDLLPLSEQLALRTGAGLTSAARALSSLSGGGMTRLGQLLKQAGITVQELREAGLAISSRYEIRGTPDRVLQSLRKILGDGDLAGGLAGSFNATAGGAMAAFKDLFRSIGTGLIPIITPLLSFLKSCLVVLTAINDVTGGWASNIMLAMLAWGGIARVLPMLRTLIDLERTLIFLQTIWTALNDWSVIVRGAELFGAILLENIARLLTMDTLMAVFDALTGNWKGIAIAAAIGAGVWYGGSRLINNAKSGANEAPAQRPARRSDVENLMAGQHARMFA